MATRSSPDDRFAEATRNLISHPGLRAGAKLTALAYLIEADRLGLSRLDSATAEKRTGLTRSAVFRARRQLESAGILTPVACDRRGTTYKLSVKPTIVRKLFRAEGFAR
jgi:GTP-sensing pleiotropic transcriptional regulator CodY